MPSEIVAALIAATVSLVGILVSIYLGRRVHRRTLDLEKFKRSLEQHFSKANAAKRYLAALECLRTTFWEVLDTLPDKHGEPIPPGLLDQLINDLKLAIDATRDTWGDVRADTSIADLDRLRDLRHDTREPIRAVQTGLHQLRDAVKSNSIRSRSVAVSSLRKYTIRSMHRLERLARFVAPLTDWVENAPDGS